MSAKNESLDLKLRLLCGLPIYIEDFGYVKPKNISDILAFGYSKYMALLTYFNLTVEDLLGEDVDETIKKFDVFDIFLYLADSELLEDFSSSLSFFLDGKVTINKENGVILIEDGIDNIRLITRKNYRDICSIVKWQNYVQEISSEDDFFNPVDEETRKFKEELERLKRIREKAKKKKDGNEESDESMTLYELISSISAISYMKEKDILDMTVYQLYERFKRLGLIDEYNVNIKSMLAGVSCKNLKHWSSKI